MNTIEAGDMVDDFVDNRPTGKNTTEESVGKEIPSSQSIFVPVAQTSRRV